MEKTIENAIDNGLESISSGLYIFSVVFGIVLVIVGVTLFLTNKGSKGRTNSGLVCFGIGIVAILSGLMQM